MTTLLFNVILLLITYSLGIFSVIIICASKKKGDNTGGSTSKKDHPNVIMINAGPNVSGPENESERCKKDKSVQHSTQMRTKEATTPTKTKTEQQLSDGVNLKKSDLKTDREKHDEEDDGKKYGDTIKDDTLNDTDCDWGAAEVVYKGDRKKKKKKKH